MDFGNITNIKILLINQCRDIFVASALLKVSVLVVDLLMFFFWLRNKYFFIEDHKKVLPSEVLQINKHNSYSFVHIKECWEWEHVIYACTLRALHKVSN